MNVPLSRLAALGTAACVLALAPRPAGALTLLDARLSLEGRPAPVLTVALAAEEKGKAEEPAQGEGGDAKPGDASLDFDLLGAPPPTPPVDDRGMHRRRTMLKWHQGIGLGLFALQVATTAVGQLNYSDKYGSNAPRTAKYEATHAALAFTNLGVFAVNGTIALLAPSPKNEVKRGFDRVSLHKLGMAIAAAGMLAQGATGIYTSSREGYLNQERWAKTHLAIGYATFAAMSVAVGALVF
jgi:hypothetical protein